MILSVDLIAEWRDEHFRPTVNVGNRVHVIALRLDDGQQPTEALIVRSEYLGSSHYPTVDTFTEWVPFDALRISGLGR